jgi:hypothetical protein
LLATLRTDGSPADIGGGTMMAEAVSPVVAMLGNRPEPPPPPPEPPPPPRARPERAAAPVAPPPRLERPAPEETQVADVEETSEAPRRVAPLPPARPYDLGGLREASAIPTPPRRGEEKRALYFASARPVHQDPLARLLSHKPARSLLDDDN